MTRDQLIKDFKNTRDIKASNLNDIPMVNRDFYLARQQNLNLKHQKKDQKLQEKT